MLTLLVVKHFFFDFLYQPPYMYQNKGTYGHVGGVYHSMLHSVATMVILLKFGVDAVLVLYLFVGEFLIHYHMDWFKMWYNKRKGWGPNTHNQFWILLGVDQLVHYLTYIGILAVVW
jgi:hypothetical protein